jgi:hypothetical protein
VELAQQIQNRASTTNLPFNGNVEDYANSFIEKIVVAAYVDYISNLFSTAKRDVSQQERESIANQAVDCMRNIKWNFNNPKTSANSAKNESANLAAVALFLGMLESSSGSSNNSSSYTDRTPSQSNSQVCRYCKPTNEKGFEIADYDRNKGININYRYIKLMPGKKPCSRCKGLGVCTTGLNQCIYSRIIEGNYICGDCHGDRFEECKECRGTGKLN